MNTELALIAAVFHMLNHATFKASLFMATGIVDHETGTRDLRRLSGLRHAMPITAMLATVAAGAMAGVPLLNGFLSKEMFFEESIVVGGSRRHADSAARDRHAGEHLQRGVLGALHSRGVLRRRRPRTCRACRTSPR